MMSTKEINDGNLVCSLCGDIDGYWLYACEHCDAIWCSDDPLLKTEPEECLCGNGEVECGWVQCCTCNE